MNIQKLLTDHIDIWTAAETEKKSGRGRSSGNAGNVYGIKKLRELILELAVRGKLVPQDANDEPASELLKRIQAEKARLVAEGKSKSPLTPLLQRGESTATAANSNSTSPPLVKGGPRGISLEEQPFELPWGWEWSRFGDALISRDAERIPVSSDERQFQKGQYDYYGASGVIDKIDKFLFDKPLLLIGEDGANLINRSTPIAFIARGKYWVNNHAHVLDGISEDFLRYIELYINAIDLKPYVTGTAQPKMNQTKMNGIILALPPEAEQHRIVAKVDELMALCDQLETQHSNAAEAHEKLVSHLLGTLTQSPTSVSPLCKRGAGGDLDWQRIAAHFDTLFTTEASIDALKQTLLQLAVMGKLVPQDPNDEPASELLKRIQAEKARLVAEGKIKSKSPLTPLLQRGESKATAMAAMSSTAAFESERTPPTLTSTTSPPLVKGGPGGISEHEMPFELPRGWESIYFGEIIELVSGQHLKPTEYFDKPKNGSIPYITGPADFSNEGPVPTRYTFERRALSIYGDILVTVKGSGVGKSNVVCQEELAISRQLMAVRPIIVNSNFIEKLLITLATLFQELTVGIAIPGISREDVLFAVIGIPPLAEQHRIVAKVDELMVICDHLKARITQAKQLQQKLADVLVEQAASQ